MKNGGRFRDINKTSAIAGIVLLVILVIGLLSAIIVVSLHTNAYIEYEESHIKELKVDEGISSSCPNAILKKANDAASTAKISFDIKDDVQFSNRYPDGRYIYEEYDEDNNIIETYTAERGIITISNIKKGLDIEITNDYDTSVVYISSNGDTITAYRDGESNDKEYKIEGTSYSFSCNNQQTVVTYNIYFYYTESECNKVLTRKVVMEAPEYNYLHDSKFCDEKKDLPNCKKYIYSDNELSKDTYDLDKILEDIDKTDARKYKERSLANNKLALVIVSIIVIVLLLFAIAVVVIGVKKVRRGGVLHENEIDRDYDEDSSEAFEQFAKEEYEKQNKK